MSWFAPGPAEAQVQAAEPELQDLAASVKVDRGVTCLDSSELVEHVSGWLGTDRVASPLTIEVHGSPYFARTVWFRIQRGTETLAERRFEPAPARCEDLHAAVGLAIALALKASLLDSLIGERTAGDPHASRPFRIGAEALGGIAVVPGTAFGIDLSFQQSFAERFAARLSFLGLFGPFGDFEEDQGSFQTWLTIGRLDVCSRLADLDSLDISVCVGVAAGGLYATGDAFPMSLNALIPYFALANALELDIRLSRHWSLTVAVDVLVPLLSTSFVVRDTNGKVLASHDLAAAGGLIAIGPAYRF
ncbi:MAG TPA: hypothetical protein VJV78_03660 [Polyangiales bacterium]|nr:hypothetical protein [Polyangiales bacterium]